MKYLLLIILFLISFLIHCQTITISEFVKDEEKESLSSVQVIINKGQKAVLSDSTGYYSIRFISKDTTIIEYKLIGYISQSIHIHNLNKDTVLKNIVLKSIETGPVIIAGA